MISQRPPLVGIYSPAPQSGKTTAAAFLTEHGYQVVSFAATLKTMVRVLLVNLGYSTAEATRLVYAAKDEQLPELRTDVRHLLQTLGTEWGRQCVHPELWLMCWKAAVLQHMAADVPVVCDDVRFFNEAELLRSLGGEMWLLRRPGTTRTTAHISEGDLDSYPYFDRRIDNKGEIDDLRRTIDRIATHPFTFRLSAA